MNRISRLVGTALLAAVVSTLFLASPAGAVAGFGDVADDEYFTEPIQWMVDEGITTGVSAGCFAPDEHVTRGQLAAFLHRMAGRPTAAADHGFADVVAGYQQEPVGWLREQGITTGTSPTTFDPGRGVTRGEFAAMLHRYAGEPVAPAAPFTDVIRSWQQTPVGWMVEQGITTGTSATTFSPDAPATRGQIATFLYRFVGSPVVAVDPAHPAAGCAAQVDPPPPGDEVPSLPDLPALDLELPAPPDFGATGPGLGLLATGELTTRSVDLNRDGRNETVAVDAAGNGYFEIYAVDADFSGRFEFVWIDADESGDFESFFRDSDENGLFEVIGYDSSGDAWHEHRFYDWDQNGQLDGYYLDWNGDRSFESYVADMNGDLVSDWVFMRSPGSGHFNMAITVWENGAIIWYDAEGDGYWEYGTADSNGDRVAEWTCSYGCPNGWTAAGHGVFAPTDDIEDTLLSSVNLGFASRSFDRANRHISAATSSY